MQYQWINKVEFFKNCKNNFLCFNNKTFIVDENTIKILTVLKNNNLEFSKSLKYLNTSFFNDSLSSNELKNYLNGLQKKIITEKESSKLSKIIVLGDPSKFIWYNFLTKLFSFNSNKTFVCIVAIFIINTAILVYVKNSTPVLLNFTRGFYNLVYFLGLLFLLLWHELGHIVAAKKYKLIIKEIGIGVYSIFPVLYVDLNNIWSLPKEKRVIINLGGIYFQSIFGLVLILFFRIWNYELFLDLFLLNFSILIINLIPILKFDGYWLVSDSFEILNLSRKSNEVVKSILNLKFSRLKGERTFLFVYSICRILFYVYVSYLLIKITTHLYVNFSIDLILDIMKSAYFSTLTLLLTLKYILKYGKQFFKKEK